MNVFCKTFLCRRIQKNWREGIKAEIFTFEMYLYVFCVTYLYNFRTEYAYSKRSSYFGEAPSNYQIWLNCLQCSGREDDLADCIIPTETWGAHGKCNGSNNAGVFCPSKKRSKLLPFVTFKSHSITIPVV